MSAALAIAATSEVLRYLVNRSLTRAANELGFAAPAVTTGSPPRPNQQHQADPSAVNLFLHHTTPNPAGRNIMGATRDASGRRLNNAPLILDLHYLLSAHGPEGLREIGFGTSLHALHQVGIVPREVIRRSLEALENDADPNKKAIARSRLADQIESLTVTPESLDIDALTKIWTATQSPYRPSLGILVTTVILEDVLASRIPLPVVTSTLAPAPVREFRIDSIEGSIADVRAPITTQSALIVDGAGFADANLSAMLGEEPLAISAAGSGPSRLKLNFVPASIANLRAGLQLLKLSLSSDVGGRLMRAQTVGSAVTLRPVAAVAASPNVPATPNDPNTVTGPIDVVVSPPVARTQSAILMLTSISGGLDQAIPWTAPAPANPPVDAFTTLTFKLSKVPRGTYLVRIAVDGTSSQPMPDNSGTFQPQVAL